MRHTLILLAQICSLSFWRPRGNGLGEAEVQASYWRPALGCALLWGLLAAPGCAPQPEKPSISADTMKAILMEMHIAHQGAGYIQRGDAEAQDSALVFVYNQILARHNVSRQRFLASYRAYQRRPSEFQQMHREMIEDVEVRMERLKNPDKFKQAPANNQGRDSRKQEPAKQRNE